MRPRICVTIATSDASEALRLVGELEPYADLFELRLDHLGDTAGLEDVVESTDRPMIATNRPSWEGGLFEGSEGERVRTLLDACSLGFEYADVELRAPDLDQVVEELRSMGVGVIVSSHDFEKTPGVGELRKTLRLIESHGADVAKIVGYARELGDNLTYLRFLSEEAGGRRLVSFGMGPDGVLSRVLCPLFGGYMTYASPGEGMEAAPGQMPVQRLVRIYELLGCLG